MVLKGAFIVFTGVDISLTFRHELLHCTKWISGAQLRHSTWRRGVASESSAVDKVIERGQLSVAASIHYQWMPLATIRKFISPHGHHLSCFYTSGIWRVCTTLTHYGWSLGLLVPTLLTEHSSSLWRANPTGLISEATLQWLCNRPSNSWLYSSGRLWHLCCAPGTLRTWNSLQTNTKLSILESLTLHWMPSTKRLASLPWFTRLLSMVVLLRTVNAIYLSKWKNMKAWWTNIHLQDLGVNSSN